MQQTTLKSVANSATDISGRIAVIRKDHATTKEQTLLRLVSDRSAWQRQPKGPFTRAILYVATVNLVYAMNPKQITQPGIRLTDSLEFDLDTLVSLTHTPKCQSQGKKSQV